MLVDRIRSYVSSSLWVTPALVVLASFLAALAFLAVDERIDTEDRAFLYSGGPESAREILSTVSGAMITFTGLVFSITILVLQLASSQYSPRVLRRFFRDRSSQLSLGTFIGTFTYTLVVLREVRQDGAAGVPGFSVTFAVVFVLIAVGVFVHYINHISRAIQVSAIVGSVAAETREAVERRYADGRRTTEETTVAGDLPVVGTVPSPRPGVLVRVDEEALIDLAVEADAVIEVVPATGDFVPEGSPLLLLRGSNVRQLEDPGRVRRLAQLASERTSDQDPAFGIRQLVDIAEKALSPGVNDPTTAVQAIDQIHDLLRRLAGRPFPRDERVDDEGRVRLVIHEMTWWQYVELGASEIRLYGARSLQVHRRLRAMLTDLQAVVPEDRRPPVAEQLRLLDASSGRSFEDEHDRRVAALPDAQGLGS
ncbi:MAG TPA: DUF2254 domain-containing protein [Actinomycetota bacterium]